MITIAKEFGRNLGADADAGAGAAAGGATGSVDGATAGAIARASTGTAPGMVTNIAVGLEAGSSVARRDRGSWCSAPSWTSGLAHRAAGLPKSGLVGVHVHLHGLKGDLNKLILS